MIQNGIGCYLSDSQKIDSSYKNIVFIRVYTKSQNLTLADMVVTKSQV